MPTIKVTPTLGQKIKQLRVSQNVKSKDVADAIDRSQAYMSKLEAGNASAIDINIFFAIIKYIFKDSGKSLNEILESLLSDVDIQLDKKELDERLWRRNFDTVQREIPVSRSLLDELSEIMKENSIEISSLVEYVNYNHDFDGEPDRENILRNPPNFWFSTDRGDSFSIIMELKESEIYDIFSHKKTDCNHVTIQALAYNLFRMTGSAEKSAEDKTKELLMRHKFYTLEERNEFIRNSNTNDEIEAKLSQLDIETNKLINDIRRELSTYTQIMMRKSKERLSVFVRNLNKNKGLTLALIGVDLSPLDDKSQIVKQKFLDEYREMIAKYSKIQSDPDEIELQ